MTRIVLLGNAGTGKTTLSRRLGVASGAPVICLDAIWQASWGEAEVPRFRDALREAHAAEAWISDGNFAAATFDIRLPRADLILWLEAPRWLSLLRATTRLLQPDEPHRPADLRKVWRFIWNFDRINRPRIEALRARHGPSVPIARLRRRRDVEALVARLRA